MYASIQPSFAHARAFASNRWETEDRAEIYAIGADLVIAVADGAGNTGRGGLASDAFIDRVKNVLADPHVSVHDVRRWLRLFEELDRDLARRACETTGVVVVVGREGVIGVSAGDSQAWVVGDSSVDRLTENQIKKRLGSGRASPVLFHRTSLDGVLLVGTDGLFDHVDAIAIADACRRGTLSEIVTRLVDRASGSPDRRNPADDVALVVVGSR
jgi:serine/threonine protein phosphatase PrpC